MRRLGCSLGLALALLCPVYASQVVDVLESLAVYPSVIIYNAKIYTMDKDLSSYQAIALRDNHIWRLGTDEEIRKLVGPKTKSIDAKGRTVVPGLIDVHTQPQLWGMLHLGIQVRSAASVAVRRGKRSAGVEEPVARNRCRGGFTRPDPTSGSSPRSREIWRRGHWQAGSPKAISTRSLPSHPSP